MTKKIQPDHSQAPPVSEALDSVVENARLLERQRAALEALVGGAAGGEPPAGFAPGKAAVDFLIERHTILLRALRSALLTEAQERVQAAAEAVDCLRRDEIRPRLERRDAAALAVRQRHSHERRVTRQQLEPGRSLADLASEQARLDVELAAAGQQLRRLQWALEAARRWRQRVLLVGPADDGELLRLARERVA